MLRNPFKRYRGFFKGQFLNALVFKFEIYVWVLQDIFTAIILVFLWLAIYKENGGMNAPINGFTYSEMIAYLLLAQLTNQWVSSSLSFQTTGQDIIKGDIAISLTKPLNYRNRALASTFGSSAASFVLIFVPLYIILFVTLHFTLGIAFPLWYNALLYLLSGFIAVIVADSYDFLCAQAAFVTSSLFGVMLIKDTVRNFFSGSVIPFSFFPAWAVPILTYSPFAGLVSTPTNIGLNRYDLMTSLRMVGTQAAWAVVLYLVSYFVNRAMLRHTVAVGG